MRMELERHQKLVGEVDVTPVQQRVSRLEDELEQLRQCARALALPAALLDGLAAADRMCSTGRKQTMNTFATVCCTSL